VIASAGFRPATWLALLLASPTVLAAAYPYSADTAATARRQGAVPAGEINWHCAGSRCAAASTAPDPTVAACHALAQQVGPVKSYGNKRRLLSAGELQRCNAGIPTGQPAGVPTATLARAPQAVAAARGPIVINAATLRYAGRGPVVITTDTLRYAGRGSVIINADTLRYAGRGPVVINADTLRYAGRGPVVINADTLRYAGPIPVRLPANPPLKPGAAR
jgi:hypothetical protein